MGIRKMSIQKVILCQSLQQNSSRKISCWTYDLSSHYFFLPGFMRILPVQRTVNQIRKQLIARNVHATIVSMSISCQQVITAAHINYNSRRLLMISYLAFSRAASDTVKANQWGTNFQISPNLISSCPLTKVYGVFINNVLTSCSVGTPRSMKIACIF